jgi:sigma-B regulation protein RsbU (phosphoserine phosphatase)
MAHTRTLLRTIAPVEVSPSATLKRLNDLLLHDTRAEMFVSLWYGVWEPDAGWVTYSNAGHSPPLLFDQGRTPVRLRQRQTVLGVLPEVAYEDTQVELSPGALLLLYTDGVSEAQDAAGALFGVERIEASVAATERWDPEAVLEALDRSLAAFSGEHDPLDDLTLVCLLRLATPAPALASRRSL